MKKFKRLIAVILSAVLVLTMLTACDGTGSSTQDKVLAALNEARAQHGVGAVTMSEEANSIAKNTATELERLIYSGNYAQDVDKLAVQLVSSSAEGKGYKDFTLIEDADAVTAARFINESVASNGNATIAGVAIANDARGLKWAVIVLY